MFQSGIIKRPVSRCIADDGGGDWNKKPSQRDKGDGEEETRNQITRLRTIALFLGDASFDLFNLINVTFAVVRFLTFLLLYNSTDRVDEDDNNINTLRSEE